MHSNFDLGNYGRIGVQRNHRLTLQVANRQDVFALDAELYLSKQWTDDPRRMRSAKIPEHVGYQPKWKLALDMLERAAAQGFDGLALADAEFGSVTKFRESVSEHGLKYAVGIDNTIAIIDATLDLGTPPPRKKQRGRPPSRPQKVSAGLETESVKQWALRQASDFRRVTWRVGTKGKMQQRFAAWRVRPAYKTRAGRTPLSPVWLLAEWPADKDAPTKYFFLSLDERTSLQRLVTTAKSRWPVEQSYRELKQELGFDHFEGRSYRGWQHHVTLVFLAYAFLVAERRKKRGA